MRYHLKSQLNRIRGVYYLLNSIVYQEDKCLKDSDFLESFGDYNFDALTESDRKVYWEEKNIDTYRYDLLFFDFPNEFNNKLFTLNTVWNKFLEQALPIYDEKEYWVKLEKLESWKQVQKQCEVLIPEFEEYFKTLGIEYERGFPRNSS